ncbi:hypothetical protein LEP1GSC021_2111 [Leptospira noguchii str. 1993005606]|nr:hypothetical protein LEP1GSC021_2111 [Leptospira noguchii str. 1993005606]
MNCFPWVAIQVEKFGRFFSIRKTYFLQVKRLVGTLEKCVFLSLKRFLRKRFRSLDGSRYWYFIKIESDSVVLQ